LDIKYNRKFGGNKRIGGRKNKKQNLATCVKRCSQQREGKIKKNPKYTQD